MCYPLPGPRCASHLSADIARVKEELGALDLIEQDDLTPQQKKTWMSAYNQLADLGVQYDGTKTGQAVLDQQITTAPNRKTQDFLVNRKLVAKELYDAKKRALKLTEGANDTFEHNKALYLQGNTEELAQSLLKDAPLDSKETPASRRQMERNAVLNFRAQLEPYKTVVDTMGGNPTVRNNVTPKGYFVVSGKSSYGSGQTHYVFKGDAKDRDKAELVGHVQVSLNPDFSVTAKGYRGNGIRGGDTVAVQMSHMDYFKAVINPGFASSENRDRFDFDDLRRVDWGEWSDSKAPARARAGSRR